MTKVEYYVSKGVKYSAKTGRKLTNQSAKSSDLWTYSKVSKPDKFKKKNKTTTKKEGGKKKVEEKKSGEECK